MNQSTALELIKKWRKKLNLTHWSFAISANLPAPAHDMEIVMTPTRQFAAIRIAERCWSFSKARFEKLIIHEMLHVLFDPIEREHERSVDTDLQDINGVYYKETVETTLDHMAIVLYNLEKK